MSKVFGLSPARLLAYEVLREVETREAFAPETLNAHLDRSKLGERERAQATALAYGAIGAQGVLEELLARYAHSPKSLKSKVRTALRLSLYELFFTESQSYAAVSQGVELMKKVHPHSRGLANAILRAAEKDRDAFPFGDPDEDLQALARLHGAPLFLVLKVKDQLGKDAARKFTKSLSSAAPNYLYLPHAYKNELELKTKVLYSSFGGATHLIKDSFQIATEKLIESRKALVMDKNAQQVVYFVVASAKENNADAVLEIGSGRGSKSLMLSYELEPNTMIYSVDSFEFKTKQNKEAATLLGQNSIYPFTADATNEQDLTVKLKQVGAPSSFKQVFIDAPCSGLGTLRRHPDKRWRIAQKDIDELSHLSFKLVETAAKFVEVDGYLSYATCTMTLEENQQLIEDFLKSKTGSLFEIAPLDRSVLIEGNEDYITDEGYFLSLPKTGDADGHFLVRLKRTK